MIDMFYAISGINGDYEAYKRALKKLKFQNLDDIKEEDIMNEEAVISTLEGEDVLYVLGNIIGAGGGSMKILQDMMSRDNVIAVVGENEYKITQALKALNDHIQSTGEVPPQMLVDKITSMLGEELSGAVEEFLQRGIPVAIGTDGPASNNCLDMFREMFLVTALAKYRENDASAVDAGKVLRMAAVGGAGSMGLSDSDILAAGKQADLILIDLHQPNMQPINHIVKNLVYSGSKSNVALTMIAGKILYERGSFFIGEDPEAIYAKANEITRRLGDAQ